jgi:hypothetical protein
MEKLSTVDLPTHAGSRERPIELDDDGTTREDVEIEEDIKTPEGKGENDLGHSKKRKSAGSEDFSDQGRSIVQNVVIELYQPQFRITEGWRQNETSVGDIYRSEAAAFRKLIEMVWDYGDQLHVNVDAEWSMEDDPITPYPERPTDDELFEYFESRFMNLYAAKGYLEAIGEMGMFCLENNCCCDFELRKLKINDTVDELDTVLL